MKYALNTFGYKHYSYVNNLVDYGITISNDPGNITEVLDATYFLRGMKGLCDKYLLYLGPP